MIHKRKRKHKWGTIRRTNKKAGLFKSSRFFVLPVVRYKSFPSPLTKEYARQPAQNQAAIGCASALRRTSNLAFIFWINSEA